MVNRILIIGILATLTLSSCRKDDNESGVPFVPVDITININLPEYNALAVPSGWVNVGGGSRGILIYRASPSDFIAYDRHCPYQSQDLCAIIMQDNNVIAVDMDCCQTHYLITDGSVTQGPGSLPLHRYNTTFNGSQLRIFN